MSEELFREDAYLRRCEARVVERRDGGIVLDRTTFYPRGGGQPGDQGELAFSDGTRIMIRDTRKDRDGAILHQVVEDASLPEPGATVQAEIDWDYRHRLMRMHTAMHLLCRAVDENVTGGQVGLAKSRLDFDVRATSFDKQAIQARLQAWVAEDRPVRAFWIDEEELDRRPELVRTISVRPPKGAGRVRLVEIEDIDLQACGGTHVARTGEIGEVRLGKIENKGKRNRRFNLHLED